LKQVTFSMNRLRPHIFDAINRSSVFQYGLLTAHYV
jgi:hypothetical protein